MKLIYRTRVIDFQIEEYFRVQFKRHWWSRWCDDTHICYSKTEYPRTLKEHALKLAQARANALLQHAVVFDSKGDGNDRHR